MIEEIDGVDVGLVAGADDLGKQQAAGCPTSTYVVFLSVVDDAGDRDSTSQPITVTCPLP